MKTPSDHFQPPWRTAGIQRSWGGKSELAWLLSRLGAANESSFEKLALILLRLALSPPDRMLDSEAFQACYGGYQVRAGNLALPVFVRPVAFQERSEDLGAPHVLRCREHIESFVKTPIQVGAFLLVHNRDPRSLEFRQGLEAALEALRASGRVAHALVWDSRDLAEAAFDSLYELILTGARTDRLSVASIEALVEGSASVVNVVPLRTSTLRMDQHRVLSEEIGAEIVADPAALLIETSPAVRTFLLGGFGYGKTTAVARSLLREDVRILYVPGASLSQQIATEKVFLSHCISADSFFKDSPPEELEIYRVMLRAVAEYLLKDPSLPCVLVIDGLDESPFLCRGAALQHLINVLDSVRVPVVLAMRSEYWLSRKGDLSSTAGGLASRGEPRIRQIRALELLDWGNEEIIRFLQSFRETVESPDERQRLEALEALVERAAFHQIYGDIPCRPLFLRLIAESVAEFGLPSQRVGRARLFRDWALWKIRRDLRVPRPQLRFAGEPTEEVLETAWEAMLHAAASMTEERAGQLEFLPECSFERLRQATPRLGKVADVLALSLQSLLILARERPGSPYARISFAHRAFQEFYLAWFLAESFLDRSWKLPEPVQAWIRDLRQEGLLDPAGRREAERPPGLPPSPTGPLQWAPYEAADSKVRAPDAEPAALILHALERAGGRRRLFDLFLTARDPALELQQSRFGTIEFLTDPEEFFCRQIQQLDEGVSVASLGSFLSEKILPPHLRETLSTLRNRVENLLIVSDDPWIPWELLRIEESPASVGIDGPFLAEAFAMTRWLHQVRPTNYLPLARIAAVVPRSEDLANSEREWEDLRVLANPGRRVERIPARLQAIDEAFRAGVYDGWHFTGHGFFRASSPGLSSIWLDEREEMTTVHLTGAAKRMGVKHPLVFLNACETAVPGLSLTDIGGWAYHFIKAGAGAFIGSRFPIRDVRSREFARAFYASFIGGQPIAKAVQAARQAIRSADDPTWLAYTVFAHPWAVCQPLPAQRRKTRKKDRSESRTG